MSLNPNTINQSIVYFPFIFYVTSSTPPPSPHSSTMSIRLLPILLLCRFVYFPFYYYVNSSTSHLLLYQFFYFPFVYYANLSTSNSFTMPIRLFFMYLLCQFVYSVAQLDAPSDWRPGGRGFNPRRGRQHSFVEIDHEIFSTVILSLPLIQEGQLSVSGERMCTILVNRLED